MTEEANPASGRQQPFLVLDHQLRDTLLRLSLKSMTPKDFEEFCYLLLANNSDYTSVNYVGHGGADGGRDITGTRRRPEGSEILMVFQCKHQKIYNSARPFKESLEAICARATDAQLIAFVTTSDLTARLMDSVESFAKSRGAPPLEFWGPTRLISMLPTDAASVAEMLGLNTNAVEGAREGIDAVVRATKYSAERAVLEGLLGQLRVMASELRAVRMTAQVAVVVFLGLQAAKVLTEFHLPLTRLDRDREKTRRLRESSEERWKRFGEAVELLRQKPIHNATALRTDFYDIALTHGLGLAEDLFAVLEAGHREGVPPEVLARYLVRLSTLTPERFDGLHASLLSAVYLTWVELKEHIKENNERRWIYPQSGSKRCPACEEVAPLQPQKLGYLQLVSAKGEYLAVYGSFLLCRSCDYCEYVELGLRLG
ncbi:MAG: restriction endonuclease [Rubrivivax sp.]|nr:restriction endonuclease [Rubrivivax sp.]